MPDPSPDEAVPEADAADQAEPVQPLPRADRPSTDPEAPEADAIEQAEPVPFDDEEMRDS